MLMDVMSVPNVAPDYIKCHYMSTFIGNTWQPQIPSLGRQERNQVWSAADVEHPLQGLMFCACWDVDFCWLLLLLTSQQLKPIWPFSNLLSTRHLFPPTRLLSLKKKNLPTLFSVNSRDCLSGIPRRSAVSESLRPAHYVKSLRKVYYYLNYDYSSSSQLQVYSM